MPDYLTTTSGRRIAYVKTPGDQTGVVFLGGFVSDMQGTKATHLEAWAKARGRAFLRFDYSGHGQSSGDFIDGSIGDWVEDAAALIERVTEGQQILVGSSMGGWIGLILAGRICNKIGGIVGISTAADFTEDNFWDGFSDNQRRDLQEYGQVVVPSDRDEPFVVTRRLIEDGRRHLVLRRPLSLPFPVRFLHGTGDTSVDLTEAMRILAHASGDDIRLTLVKGADHSFSSPECLALIESALQEVIDRA